MQKPIAEGKNVEKRGKKGKIWIKLATIQSIISQNQNALSCARKREQKGSKNGAKTRENGAKEREEKKKKGVMY